MTWRIVLRRRACARWCGGWPTRSNGVGVPPSLLEAEPTGLQGNCLSAALSGADALALPGRGPLTVPPPAPAP
jgi:hypothetical protein